MSRRREPVLGDPAAGADRVVRLWIRERARFLVIASAITIAVCLSCAWVAATTSQWRGDVRRTGAKATGEVTRITRRTRKEGSGDNVHIQVDDAEPFSIVVVTEHLRYLVGDRVPVRYDPSNRRHAAIPASSTRNDWWTVAAAIVAVTAGLAGLLVLVGWWYLVLVAAIGRSMHETTVTLSPPRVRVRAGVRRVMTFADSDTPWSSAFQEASVREGRVFVAGRRLWRVVWYPDTDRPFVVRRPRTPLGTWLWRRSARGTGGRARR